VFFHSLVASLELVVLVAERVQVHGEGVDSGVHFSHLFTEVLNGFDQQVVLHGCHFFCVRGRGLKSTSLLVDEEVTVVNVSAWCVLALLVILTPKYRVGGRPWD
jgi:hypothetical protein